MSNINLYQDGRVGEKTSRESFLDKGMIVGVLVLGIVLAGYGGLQVYLRSLNQKIEASQKEASDARKSLDGEGVNLAASFQQRLDMLESAKSVFDKNDPAKVFQNVQDAMIQGVVASEIGFKDRTLKVVFLADSFEILASQIMSFKKSGAFRDVQVKNSVRTEDGKVNTELSMALSL